VDVLDAAWRHTFHPLWAVLARSLFMTPPTPSRPVRITAETRIPYPCWLLKGATNELTDCRTYIPRAMVSQLMAMGFTHYISGDYQPDVATPTAPDLSAGNKAMDLAVSIKGAFSLLGKPSAEYIATTCIEPFLATLPAPIPVTAPLPASEGTPRTAWALSRVLSRAEAAEDIPVEANWRVAVSEMTDFARTLELELNEAKERLKGAAVGASEAHKQYAIYERQLMEQRDAHWKELATLTAQLTAAQNKLFSSEAEAQMERERASDIATLLATAEKERDEAIQAVGEANMKLSEAHQEGIKVGQLEARLTAPASPATPDPDNLQSHRALVMMSVSPATPDKRVEECAREITALERTFTHPGQFQAGLIAILSRHFTTPTK
jgi:hypothetical protein